jgi:N-acetylmuramoyl-L-alanine amidase
MKIYVCTGHANYGNMISSADGSSVGGCNEYNYNKELLPYIKKWCEKVGIICYTDTPEVGKLHSLEDEINYYISHANAKDYDLVVQLHLNACNEKASGCEVWYYPSSAMGMQYANSVCNKLGTVWNNRGIKESKTLYWLRKTIAPSILIESFFCDNASNYLKAVKLGLNAHAKLIVEGILGRDITIDNTRYSVLVGNYDKKVATSVSKELSSLGYKTEVVRR